MSTRGRSFFRRLDIRFPWLKLVVVCLAGVAMIADLCDLTISHVGDPLNKIRIAPMSHHVRVTKRTLDGKKLVALTFDDGPSPETTPRLLTILFDKDVPATFFTLGNMAEKHPEIIKEAEKKGNEIGSHTMYHQNLITLSADAVQADISQAKSVIKSILGHSPSYTRPPYGNINDNVRRAVSNPMILWSVDTEDWKSKDPDTIIATAMSEVHDGAIILMHDIYPTSVDAVPKLIDTLREQGYEFTTIKELTKARGVALSPGATYYNFRP